LRHHQTRVAELHAVVILVIRVAAEGEHVVVALLRLMLGGELGLQVVWRGQV